MNNCKVGDRVAFKDAVKDRLNFPHIGTIQALMTRVRVDWSDGTQSTEKLGDLQPAHATQPETSAAALMSYGAEKAELQRILTKRNATIGRLRAANRELRRELSERDEIKLPPPEHCTPEFIAAFNSAEKREPEPTPLPTVPPRVGGVYRTRGGEAIKITSKSDSTRHPFFGRTETDGRALSFTRNGCYLDHGEPDICDLVAEISPPPEPAFEGPLEVGGWYEDEQSRRWECVGCYVKVDGSSFICERNGIHQMYFRPDGTSEFILGVKLIRKVDPPGGES